MRRNDKGFAIAAGSLLAVAAVAGCAQGLAKPAPQQACRLQAVTPAAGGFSIDEPDDAAAPTAWQGPFHFHAKGAPACDLGSDDGLISGPFLSDGADRMFYLSYSGSLQKAVLVDTRTCRRVWASAAFGKGSLSSPAPATLRVGGRTVTLKGDCSPAR